LIFLKDVERHFGSCTGCSPPRITVESTEFAVVSTEQARASLTDSLEYITELGAAAWTDAFFSVGLFAIDCPSLGSSAIDASGPLTLIATSGLHGPLALLRDNTAYAGFEDGASRLLITSDLNQLQSEQRYAAQYLRDLMAPDLAIFYIPPYINPCIGQLSGPLARLNSLVAVLAVLWT
jgi:hypothetical protein